MHLDLSSVLKPDGGHRLAGDLVMPKDFQASFASGELLAGISVNLSVEIDETGRPVCTALHLDADEGGEINWSHLRGLALAQLLRNLKTAAAESGLQVEQLESGAFRVGPMSDEAAERAFEVSRREGKRKPRQSVDDVLLREVAEKYAEALEGGDGVESEDPSYWRRSPTRYVARKLGQDHYHWAKGVFSMARRAGKLAATTPGRRAGKPGTGS